MKSKRIHGVKFLIHGIGLKSFHVKRVIWLHSFAYFKLEHSKVSKILFQFSFNHWKNDLPNFWGIGNFPIFQKLKKQMFVINLQNT